jgi:hypothetical protein
LLLCQRKLRKGKGRQQESEDSSEEGTSSRVDQHESRSGGGGSVEGDATQSTEQLMAEIDDLLGDAGAGNSGAAAAAAAAAAAVGTTDAEPEGGRQHRARGPPVRHRDGA